MRRIEQNEREIAHWEARTTETEKAALELAMCVEAVDRLARLWDMSEDEDRQGMARSLFSYIVYDLDTRRIVDFRLKPWADRFLVLRAVLYEAEKSNTEPKNEIAPAIEGMERAMPPRGFRPGAVFAAETAMQHFIVALYYDTVMPEYPWPSNVPLTKRNQAILDTYQRGETLERIAVAFDISIARVHQIIKNSR